MTNKKTTGSGALQSNRMSEAQILFDDPTFVVDERKTVELCNAMIKAGIKITWSCNLRANVSYETMVKMKKAGCRLAHIGIESLSQDAKNSIHKGVELGSEEKFLMDAKSAGLLIHGCFIIGLPGDTKESVRETIQKAKKLPIDSVQVFPIIPTPGTSTFKWAESTGSLTTRNYDEWLKPDGSYNCVISRPEMTSEDIAMLIKEFIREFYFRPSYFGYKLKQSIASPGELKRNFKSFRNMVSKI